MIFVIIITQLIFIGFLQLLHVNTLQKSIFYIFNFIWLGILIFSDLSGENNYHISTDTYALIWLFLFAFSTSFVFLGNRKPAQKISYNKKSMLLQYDKALLSSKILILLIIFITAVLLMYALRYSAILASDFLSARTERYFVGHLFRSTIELLFYNYVVSMFGFLFSFIICFSILFHRVKTVLFWISVFDFILFAFIGAGRFPVIMLVFNFIVLLMIKNGFEKRTLKLKSKIKYMLSTVLVIVIAFFAMSYATSIRLGESLSFNTSAIKENASVLYDQIIGYNTTSVKGLSYVLDNDIMKNHMFFGRAAAIGGIDEILANLLSWFGIPFPSASYALGAISNRVISFGGSTFNALYTCIYTFFSDSGIIGVLLFSGLFGLVVKKAIICLSNSPNIFSIMIVIHLTYFMYISHLNWKLVDVDSMIYILVIYRFNKKYGAISA